MTPVIALDAICKRFDDTLAVNDISLDFHEGEFFALLGPSGCGKTTLLRLIAGFEQPSSGRITIDGQDITVLKANQRPVNLMFQSYALFPHMNVRANISYGLEMERLGRTEITSRVDAMLDLTDLAALAKRKPHQLSGGQQQRVALARALIKQPRVLLLDEPLGALDRKLRGQMQIELKRFQHELATTFVVVTHDQEEALVMADRIALMNKGRIVQVDDPITLYEHPNSRFAADFIGDTNLFDGQATREGIRIAGLGEITTSGRLVPGTHCALSVRPERMRVRLPEQPAHTNPHLEIEGRVTDIAYHGQDSTLLIGYDSSHSDNHHSQGLATRTATITVRITNGDTRVSEYQVGQTVYCHWAPEHGRLVQETPTAEE